MQRWRDPSQQMNVILKFQEGPHIVSASGASTFLSDAGPSFTPYYSRHHTWSPALTYCVADNHTYSFSPSIIRNHWQPGNQSAFWPLDYSVATNISHSEWLHSLSLTQRQSQINYLINCTIFTRHTERSGVWKSGPVLVSLCVLCPVTDISATVAPIGVKFRTMIHIGPGQVFSSFWSVSAPRGSHKS